MVHRIDPYAYPRDLSRFAGLKAAFDDAAPLCALLGMKIVALEGTPWVDEGIVIHQAGPECLGDIVHRATVFKCESNPFITVKLTSVFEATRERVMADWGARWGNTQQLLERRIRNCASAHLAIGTIAIM